MAATSLWMVYLHMAQTLTTQAPLSSKSKTKITSQEAPIAQTLNFNTNPWTITTKAVQTSKPSKEITRILVRTRWWLTRAEAWASARISSIVEMRLYKASWSTARCSTKVQAPFTMRKSESVQMLCLLIEETYRDVFRSFKEHDKGEGLIEVIDDSILKF